MSFASDVANASKAFVANAAAFAPTSGDDVVHISKDPLTNLYKVEVNGNAYFVTKRALEASDFDLGAGDDKLIVDPDVDANITAHGGSGDDTMIGGKGDDRFDGGSGDDTLIGGAGNDRLIGGSGNDTLVGGPGHDELNGGSDNNTLVSDPADWLFPPGVRISELMWRDGPRPGGRVR